jgi:hypothetical protein
MGFKTARARSRRVGRVSAKVEKTIALMCIMNCVVTNFQAPRWRSQALRYYHSSARAFHLGGSLLFHQIVCRLYLLGFLRRNFEHFFRQAFGNKFVRVVLAH